MGLYKSAAQPFADAVSITPTTLDSGELEFKVSFEEREADKATRIVRINTEDDDLDETDGSFTLTAPQQQGAASVEATVTVTDNDLPYVDMTVDRFVVSEGDTVTVTLTRDGALSLPLTIRRELSDDLFFPVATRRLHDVPHNIPCGQQHRFVSCFFGRRCAVLHVQATERYA